MGTREVTPTPLPCSACDASDVRVEPDSFIGYNVYCYACYDYCPCGECPLSTVAHGKTEAEAVEWWNALASEEGKTDGA